ncbi:MAG: metallophosphoesterase [Synechococcales cyanobacterium CRU_2_2]|nr:metallophosphoesterase [Synechococcales cyanobacterium CRU_2_2]
MQIRRRQLIFFAAVAASGVACDRWDLVSGNRAAADSIIDVAGNSAATDQLPPGDRSPSSPSVRIVVLSDLNSQYGSTTYEPEVDQAIRLIPGWKPDLVLCGGDMVAGQKRELSNAQVTAMWDAFDRHIRQPLAAAKIPLGFTLGNHDASGARRDGILSFERDRNLARDYWTHPSHDPGLNFVDRTHFPFYYTFQQNEIFYLVWDASTAQISSAQFAWVDQSLSSAQARSAKLRIALGHLPLYPVAVGRDRPGEFLDGGEALRSRLEHYNVHTYISGHNHAYYPGFRGQLELLHSGAIGSGPRQLIGSDRPPQKTVTIVDILADSARSLYTTYQLPSLELLTPAMLPPRIQSTSSPETPVTRRDLRS